MVSGLVTSPCDHCRIFSGDASEIRIASKSGANCVFSCWNRNTLISPLFNYTKQLFFELWSWIFVLCQDAPRTNKEQSTKHQDPLRLNRTSNDRFAHALFRGAVARCLLIDQLNIETERLQLAYEYVERLRQTWIEISFA